MTVTDEKLMAAAAKIGLRKVLKNGKNTPAAMEEGKFVTLYRFIMIGPARNFPSSLSCFVSFA
jgi:hypothetical protein